MSMWGGNDWKRSKPYYEMGIPGILECCVDPDPGMRNMARGLLIASSGILIILGGAIFGFIAWL